MIMVFSQERLLQAFRLINETSSGAYRKRQIAFAPYFPKNRPIDYSLKLGNNRICLSIQTQTKPHANIGLDFDNNTAGLSIEVLLGEATAFSLLAHEIREVGKGVNLSTRNLADARCRRLLNKPLWRGLQMPKECSILEVFTDTFDEDSKGHSPSGVTGIKVFLMANPSIGISNARSL